MFDEKELESCMTLITQFVKYANKCKDEFGEAGNQLIVSPNISSYLRCYGMPCYQICREPSEHIDGSIKCYLNIDCYEVGYFFGNASCSCIKVYVDKKLDDENFVIGIRNTPHKIDFILKRKTDE